MRYKNYSIFCENLDEIRIEIDTFFEHGPQSKYQDRDLQVGDRRKIDRRRFLNDLHHYLHYY